MNQLYLATVPPFGTSADASQSLFNLSSFSMNSVTKFFCLVATLSLICLTSFANIATAPGGPGHPGDFDLRDGDRVVYLGDTLIEREQYHGWLDVMFSSRYPDFDITFRNLGWAGDTPDGKSRLGLSLLQAGKEPDDEGWRQLVNQLEEAKPTVVVLGYGMASSFEGEAGVSEFRENYKKLRDKILEIAPDVRFIHVGPILPENIFQVLKGLRPKSGNTSPEELSLYHEQLAHYQTLTKISGISSEIESDEYIKHIETLKENDKREELRGILRKFKLPKSGLWFLDLTVDNDGPPLTSNGIHLNAAGYRAFAESFEMQLFGTEGAWRTSPHTEALRQAVLRKNEAFFNRSRPANMAYIFGFRKREQGNNAVEVLEFDKFVAAEDANIAKLRHLLPVEITVPTQRLTNRVLEYTPQALPHFEVAEGFEVTLWAENPLINKPIHMNWDAQGRLWVASSTVYPQIEPGQAPADRILVLADTTADGTADSVTTFADGLLIPTGVLPGDGGVYVAQSTEFLHFRDTDGDGIADERNIVLSGFGTEDSHHNIHTPQWGPDGRLYLNQSVYTRTRTETPHGMIDLKAGGIFRFDPRDQKMSIHYRGLINGWGHAWDAHGNSFMSDGAGFSGPSWGITGATYRTLAPARRTIQTITPGSYPKYAGIEVLNSDLFPSDWQGDLITCDFRANRIVRFKLSDDGAGFIGREQEEILRTVADSFRPIDVKLGPDGALYIADWSNPIIQHGEVDFRDTRRDKIHGRIWRVAPIGHKSSAPKDLTKLPNAELLDLLLSANAAIPLQARRVLKERGADNVIDDLDRWATANPSDAAQLQVLWLGQSLNLPLQTRARQLLVSESAPIRAATVRALSIAKADDYATAAELSRDPHPRVRLEAVRALGRFPTAQSAATALAVLDTEMDPYLDYAIWLTINELAEPWSAAVLDGSWSTEGRDTQLAFALTALLPQQAAPILAKLVAQQTLDGTGPWTQLIQDAGGPAELQALFDGAISGRFTPANTAAALNALREAARIRGVVPPGRIDALTPLLSSKNTAVQNATIRLAGVRKMNSTVPELIAIAADADTADSTLRHTFNALRDIGGTSTKNALLRIVKDTDATETIRNRAAVVLTAQDASTYAPEIIARLQQASSDSVAADLWRTLLSFKNAGNVLAESLPADPVPEAIARAGLRPAREGNQNEALVRVLMEQAGVSLSTEKLTGAQMIALAAEAEAHGDAARGEMIYRQSALACIACHAIGGAGGKVGPDLTSIGASAPTDYIIEALLYPGDKVKEGYHATLVMTNDDQVVSGVVVKEDAQELVVRDPAGQEVSVALSNVASRTNIGSLMPAGLIDNLLPQERLDLIQFLSQLGKPGRYDAARSNVARQWQVYLTWSSNRHLGVERVAEGDFTLPDWHTATSRVDGIVPPVNFQEVFPRSNNADHLFFAVQFDAAQSGAVSFTQEAELDRAWLNGTLVEFGETFTLNVKAGTNTLVFRTDPKTFPANLRLSSNDVTFR